MTDNNGYEDRIIADRLDFVKLTEEEQKMDYRELQKKYYENIKKNVEKVRKSLEEEPEEEEEIDEALQEQYIRELEEMRTKK